MPSIGNKRELPPDAVPIKDLQPGTVIQKPFGRLPFVLLDKQSFLDALAAQRRYWPGHDGTLGDRQWKYYPPVDRRNLAIIGTARTFSRHRSVNFAHSYVASSLSNGTLAFFQSTAHVRVLESDEDVQRALGRTMELNHYRRIARVQLGSLASLKIQYPRSYWSKGSAWDHLVENPPAELKRSPGVSKVDNPYRKSHTQLDWAWVAEVPIERLTLLQRLMFEE